MKIVGRRLPCPRERTNLLLSYDLPKMHVADLQVRRQFFEREGHSLSGKISRLIGADRIGHSIRDIVM